MLQELVFPSVQVTNGIDDFVIKATHPTYTEVPP